MAFGYSINQRKINKRNHVIDLFREHKILSKAMVRNHSGYSMDTIISIFNTLTEEEILIPTSGKQKSKGRKADFYTLNNLKSCYLGITFNQSGIYSSLVSFSNLVIENFTSTISLGISKEKFIEELERHINTIKSSCSRELKSITSAGCSIPGDIDLQSGILHNYSFMPSLTDMNFKEVLKDFLPDIPILIDHNIQCMTSYILMDNDLVRNNDRILYISARSGAANGIIYKGEIISGSGELGHTKVSNDDTLCTCGRKGCLDIYFSYKSFLDLLKNYEEQNGIESVPTSDENESFKRLTEYYSKGVTEIKEELDKRLFYFSYSLVNAINLTAPDLVIISGELLKVFGDPERALHEIIKKSYNDFGIVPHYNNCDIKFMDFGTEIASIGICYQMIRKDWAYYTEEKGS